MIELDSYRDYKFSDFIEYNNSQYLCLSAKGEKINCELIKSNKQFLVVKVCSIPLRNQAFQYQDILTFQKKILYSY